MAAVLLLAIGITSCDEGFDQGNCDEGFYQQNDGNGGYFCVPVTETESVDDY